MAKTLRRRIWERAEGCCENCQIPQVLDVQPFQVDHVRAQKHRGKTNFSNIALACLPCNAFKGPNVAGYDPLSNRLQRLFNPRVDDWNRHFTWNGPILIGKTSIGRTTIDVLRINAPDRVAHRELLIEADLFPPRNSVSQFLPTDHGKNIGGTASDCNTDASHLGPLETNSTVGRQRG